MPTIRHYHPTDRDAVYDICIKTGDEGQDATPSFEDPSILPDIYAGPYVTLEPELAFVVADEADTPVGYILGTADTERFAAWFAAQWLPEAASRHPLPDHPHPATHDELHALHPHPTTHDEFHALHPHPATHDEIMRDLLHHPERIVVPELAAYPAHLHIDLLPAYQGRGFGRRLMARFVDELRSGGVPGLHLGVSPTNRGALAFYARLGFEVVEVPGAGAIYLAMRLDRG